MKEVLLTGVGGGTAGGQFGALFSNPLIIAAVVIFALVRQFMPRRVNARSLLILPAILLVLGLQRWALPDLTTLRGQLSIAFLVVDAILAVGFGAARGLSMKIWRDAAGDSWMRATLLTIGLWVVSVAARLASGAVSAGLGLPLDGLMSELPILLGLTIGAQGLVVWLRTGGAAAFATTASWSQPSFASSQAPPAEWGWSGHEARRARRAARRGARR